MCIIQEQEGSAKRLSELAEYQRMVKKHMPALGRLLDSLEAGETPNFLDIMAAISESVAFYTECDYKSEELVGLSEKMSENNCRFCC